MQSGVRDNGYATSVRLPHHTALTTHCAYFCCCVSSRHIIILTAPDCISRSGLAKAHQEHAATGGGKIAYVACQSIYLLHTHVRGRQFSVQWLDVVRWVTGNELLQRIASPSTHRRDNIDGVVFNPASFAVRGQVVAVCKDAGCNDAILT